MLNQNEFLATKLGLHLQRAFFLTLTMVAFGAVVYISTVLGFDLPKWRMNGEGNRMYSYLLSGAVALGLGLLFGYKADNANKALLALDEVADAEFEEI